MIARAVVVLVENTKRQVCVCVYMPIGRRLAQALQDQRKHFRCITAHAMASIQVLCAGDKAMLCRPCVDCGVYTGRFCDYCEAAARLPNETWIRGQKTPLCSVCDNARDMCHFCAGKAWCVPPPSGNSPESAK